MVLCLGDIGRSPRMQYHATSLASTCAVDIVGYGGSVPHVALLNNPNIVRHLITPLTWKVPRALFILYAPFKVLFLYVQLLWMLFFCVSRPDFIIVQNPPAIPTLFVAKLVSVIRGSKLVIDWHNFGYSLLALSLGPKHPFVALSYWYERICGRFGDAHLCVTKAMQKELADTWSIRATVLYDCPPDFFRQISVEERHKLFMKLEKQGHLEPLREWSIRSEGKVAEEEETLFTYYDGTAYHEKAVRPAVVVSSTSWTADEDFGLLLEAIEMCECEFQARGREMPYMLFIITGKGPMRAFYENKIQHMHLRRMQVLTLWLEPEDYPMILGCSDIGVSLHTSSSGLDLPMKVVDMFGCQLPVCAVSFPCLSELVHDGHNGVHFNTSAELAQHLMILLAAFPCTTRLDRMRADLQQNHKLRWHESWTRHALPHFL